MATPSESTAEKRRYVATDRLSAKKRRLSQHDQSVTNEIQDVNRKLSILDSINILRALRTQTKEQVAEIFRCSMQNIEDINDSKTIIQHSYLRQQQNRIAKYLIVDPADQKKFEHLNNVMYGHLQHMRTVDNFLDGMSDDLFLENAAKVNACLDLHCFVPNLKWLENFKTLYKFKSFDDFPLPNDQNMFLDEQFEWAEIIRATKDRQYEKYEHPLSKEITRDMIESFQTAHVVELIQTAIAKYVDIVQQEHSTENITYVQAVPTCAMRLCEILDVRFKQILDWLRKYLSFLRQGVNTNQNVYYATITDLDLYYIVDLCLTEEVAEKKNHLLNWRMHSPSPNTSISKSVQELKCSTRRAIDEIDDDTILVKQEPLDIDEDFEEQNIVTYDEIIKEEPLDMDASQEIQKQNEPTLPEVDECATVNKDSDKSQIDWIEFEEFIKEEPTFTDVIADNPLVINSLSEVPTTSFPRTNQYSIISSEQANSHLQKLITYAKKSGRLTMLKYLHCIENVL
ncbi:uncharacterized protein LOC115622807 [Scaptodrosophila lebanonensis]|uniref:Uncharacterized protein LOC115622807 n=1 Tax=Drosophila lebanonensis TaxID=7225 RepID=A0A6J2TBI0_DROLE|nr:uncharacterized protein LOC115622807 [Scaptodrosophila lebanonensis]